MEDIKLICVQDCDIPGVRHFNAGDMMTEPELVEKYRDNPYFKLASTEEKKS